MKNRAIKFVPLAWEQYQYWCGQDRKMVNRINQLITECLREPFTGIGKPEALRHDLAGYWSRRIDHEHRLVYRATENEVVIISCRYHYD